MKNYILISLLITCLSACSSRENNSQPVTTGTGITDITMNDTVVNPNDSGVIYLHPVNGLVTEKIRKQPRQAIYLQFESQGFTKLNAHIIPEDSTANVRFSQLMMPDESGDGPFGREITYNLSRDGTYTLSVMESLMQGDPWGGVFTLRLELSR